MSNSLYSDIESEIITWNIDGHTTAGSLTRKLLSIIREEVDDIANSENSGLSSEQRLEEIKKLFDI